MITLYDLSPAQTASLIGIVLVVIGTWFVAFELVKRFLGYSYRVIDVRLDGSGVVEKTDEFKKWEIKRAFWMWTGLGLITLGSGLQAYSIFISSHAPGFEKGHSMSRIEGMDQERSEQFRLSSMSTR